MNYTMTVTSKGQVTIPAELTRKWGIEKGHKLSLIVVEGKKAVLQPATNVIEELYGSVKIPAKLKKVPIDEAIEIAKRRYFSEKFDQEYSKGRKS